jgi:hypothetical protein
MGFHRVQAQVEAVGDIFVAIAFRQQLIDLAFAVVRDSKRSEISRSTCNLAPPPWKTRATAGLKNAMP